MLGAHTLRLALTYQNSTTVEIKLGQKPLLLLYICENMVKRRPTSKQSKRSLRSFLRYTSNEMHVQMHACIRSHADVTCINNPSGSCLPKSFGLLQRKITPKPTSRKDPERAAWQVPERSDECGRAERVLRRVGVLGSVGQRHTRRCRAALPRLVSQPCCCQVVCLPCFC